MDENLKPCPCGCKKPQIHVIDGQNTAILKGNSNFNSYLTQTMLIKIYCPKCRRSSLWGSPSTIINTWNHRTKADTSLKPCPFCGGKGKLYQAMDGTYIVQCMKCGIGTAYSSHPDKAIRDWNGKRKNEKRAV